MTFEERFELYAGDLKALSVGSTSHCGECEGDEDEGRFSWSDCDTCGSGLGGDRHAGHCLDDNNELNHLDVCVDCLMYIANGDLPC